MSGSAHVPVPQPIDDFEGWLAAFSQPSVALELATLVGCVLLAWGAWQQVVVGFGSHSVVLGYSTALLPLPAFLCSVAMGLMALIELVRGTPLNLGHSAEVE